MRQRRYYIIEKDGRSLYINNGVVSSTNNRVRLAHGPLGFNEFSITWERDMNKLGIIENVSIPLGFILEDAEILRDQRYKSNIERELFLLVTQHELQYPSPGTYRHHWKHLYKAQFAFTSWNDDGTQVKLKVDAGGVSRKLKANTGTVYEIRIDAEDYELLKMDGMDLSLKQNFLITEGQVLPNVSSLVGIAMTTKEGEAAGAYFGDVFQDGNEPGNYTTDTRYFFATSQIIHGVQIKGSIKVMAPFLSHDYQLDLITNKGRFINLIPPTPLVQGQVKEISFDVAFDTQAGEKFFLVDNFAPNGIIGYLIYSETKFFVSFTSRYPTTYVKVLRPSTVMRKLLRLMGISEDQCDTSFVEQFDDYVLLSGDANRGLEDPVFKTSFDKFFSFCKVVMGAGQGVVQDKVTVQNYDYFFKTTNPIVIPRVKNLVVNDADDLYFNTVKIGYPTQDIDDVNGRYSFNNTHVYGTPVTAVTKELTLVCDYISDPYVMETHRLNLDGKTTTDNERDNNIFIADTILNTIRFSGGILFDTVTEPYLSFSGNVDRIDLFQPGQRFTVLNSTSNNTTFTVIRTEALNGGFNVFVKESVTSEAATTATVEVKYRTLRRDTYDTLEGVPTNSIFNVNLNPATLIKRHMKWINSVLYNFQGQYLKFISTDKNRGLKYTKAGATFDQDANIAIGTDRLFLPFYLDTDSEEPANLIEEMDLDPYRAFTFDSGVSGFAQRAGMRPSTHQEQAYKLLAAPDTDLLNIHRNAYK